MSTPNTRVASMRSSDSRVETASQRWASEGRFSTYTLTLPSNQVRASSLSLSDQFLACPSSARSQRPGLDRGENGLSSAEGARPSCAAKSLSSAHGNGCFRRPWQADFTAAQHQLSSSLPPPSSGLPCLHAALWAAVTGHLRSSRPRGAAGTVALQTSGSRPQTTTRHSPRGQVHIPTADNMAAATSALPAQGGPAPLGSLHTRRERLSAAASVSGESSCSDS